MRPGDAVEPCPGMPRSVTIAICTWNRASLLQRTLDSMTSLQIPRGIEWEIVVVDNASTDATPDVIAQAATKLPVHGVHEPRQGHSFARNTAVAAARGELLVWTDDDVRVERDWISEFLQGAAAEPRTQFWGGTVLPDFESPPPRWVDENWEISSRIYALRDWKGIVPQVDLKHLPFGANFAIRTAAQRSYGFDPNFGRKGTGMRGFDEVDVFRRMLDAGEIGTWRVAAKLHHFIPTSRLTLDYVRRYYVGQGETLVVRGESREPTADLKRRERSQRFWYRTKRSLGFSSRSWMPCLIEASRVAGQLSARAKQKNASDSETA